MRPRQLELPISGNLTHYPWDKRLKSASLASLCYFFDYFWSIREKLWSGKYCISVSLKRCIFPLTSLWMGKKGKKIFKIETALASRSLYCIVSNVYNSEGNQAGVLWHESNGDCWSLESWNILARGERQVFTFQNMEQSKIWDIPIIKLLKKKIDTWIEKAIQCSGRLFWLLSVTDKEPACHRAICLKSFLKQYCLVNILATLRTR